MRYIEIEPATEFRVGDFLSAVNCGHSGCISSPSCCDAISALQRVEKVFRKKPERIYIGNYIGKNKHKRVAFFLKKMNKGKRHE